MSDDFAINRENYNSKTLAIFEVVGSYFIDIYYNHLYEQAKLMKERGNVSSITSGYKHAMQAWVLSIGKTKFYTNTTKGIYDSLMNYTKFSGLTLNECINKIVIEFVPQDYFASLTGQQKAGIMKSVIHNINKNFIKKITEEFHKYLSMIIDNRNIENATIIKDIMVDILLWEKELMFNKFLREQSTTRTSGDMTNLMKNKMVDNIKSLIAELAEEREKGNMMQQIIIKNNDEINRFKETIASMDNSVATLREQLNNYKIEIERLQARPRTPIREPILKAPTPGRVRPRTPQIRETPRTPQIRETPRVPTPKIEKPSESIFESIENSDDEDLSPIFQSSKTPPRVASPIEPSHFEASHFEEPNDAPETPKKNDIASQLQSLEDFINSDFENSNIDFY